MGICEPISLYNQELLKMDRLCASAKGALVLIKLEQKGNFLVMCNRVLAICSRCQRFEWRLA